MVGYLMSELLRTGVGGTDEDVDVDGLSNMIVEVGAEPDAAVIMSFQRAMYQCRGGRSRGDGGEPAGCCFV